MQCLITPLSDDVQVRIIAIPANIPNPPLDPFWPFGPCGPVEPVMEEIGC